MFGVRSNGKHGWRGDWQEPACLVGVPAGCRSLVAIDIDGRRWLQLISVVVAARSRPAPPRLHCNIEKQPRETVFEQSSQLSPPWQHLQRLSDGTPSASCLAEKRHFARLGRQGKGSVLRL